MSFTFAMTEVDLLYRSLRDAGEPGLALEALSLRHAIQARRYARFPEEAHRDDELRILAIGPMMEMPEPDSEAGALVRPPPSRWLRLWAWMRG